VGDQEYFIVPPKELYNCICLHGVIGENVIIDGWEVIWIGLFTLKQNFITISRQDLEQGKIWSKFLEQVESGLLLTFWGANKFRIKYKDERDKKKIALQNIF